MYFAYSTVTWIVLILLLFGAIGAYIYVKKKQG